MKDSLNWVKEINGGNQNGMWKKTKTKETEGSKAEVNARLYSVGCEIQELNNQIVKEVRTKMEENTKEAIQDTVSVVTDVLDTDKDGTVSLDEVKQIVANVQKMGENIGNYFNEIKEKLDTNKDGKVETSEIIEGAKNIFKEYGILFLTIIIGQIALFSDSIAEYGTIVRLFQLGALSINILYGGTLKANLQKMLGIKDKEHEIEVKALNDTIDTQKEEIERLKGELVEARAENKVLKTLNEFGLKN